MIEYKVENNLRTEEFRDILIRSTLGERRPIDNPQRLQRMLEHANLIVTARDNGLLVGVSRALTDFSYCTFPTWLLIKPIKERELEKN